MPALLKANKGVVYSLQHVQLRRKTGRGESHTKKKRLTAGRRGESSRRAHERVIASLARLQLINAFQIRARLHCIIKLPEQLVIRRARAIITRKSIRLQCAKGSIKHRASEQSEKRATSAKSRETLSSSAALLCLVAQSIRARTLYIQWKCLLAQ